MATAKSSLFDTATTVGKIMSFLGISALCGLLAAGLLFPMAATGGAAASAGHNILHEVPVELQEEPLSTPSHMYARDGETWIATFYVENRVPVPLEDISQEMQDAIVAIEDERFFQHGGVDAQGVARAAVNNIMSSNTQGASTLTMQYVNNILNNAMVVRGEADNILAAGIQEKTYADKLREMKLAVQLEQEMTKEEILEGYLNIVMLGGVNYGVEAAAQYYFGVPASELDVQQAATLAGIVQAPNHYRPDRNVAAAENRRNQVLGNMHRHGFISEEEYQEARDTDLAETLLPEDEMNNERGCVAAEFAHYFCDYATQEIMQNEAFGDTPEERAELLHRGGLRITTTLDPELQEHAENTVEQHRPSGTRAAAVLNSLDPETGDILTMAQSTNYNPDDAGDWDDISLNLNAGTSHNGGEGFQGGSILKPFVAAAWVEEGNSMDDRVAADTTEYPYGEEWEASCMPGGSFTLLGPEGESWDVWNVMDDTEREMSVDWGLYYSINTATIATAHAMDLCAFTDLTDRLGIEGQTEDRPLGPLHPDTPSVTLGTASITPMVVNRAYAAFANDGTICTPRALLEVTDAHGNSYEVPEPDCEEVVDPDVVAQVNDTLINIAEQNQYVQQRDGSAPFPMAGKTGTHQSVSVMSFVGYTEGISTSAYITRIYDDGCMWPEGAIEGVPCHGNIPESYAGDVAFPFWYDYMRQAAPTRDTGDFATSPNSPFDERRSSWSGRYNPSELGSGGGSNSNDENDDDNGDSDEDDSDEDDD
ncbi:transglycosylase domain-containing protein [Nesterenkonia alkaliphila]|uniref:Penicillin-binding protein n=1 Tax=Nesterenkonia alkaliphila TaxID=1463631 RepID=A0A7K1UI01_9MICC|nr:transglycosylase domain-containing protein [Nesterenkonia alkaliphila]MVT26036.1 penicillin-binding protein [Nesterenkonia alkaliphila]GFZ86250.1 penicillin-binding protein [Nesterenkonia alkaliphila]